MVESPVLTVFSPLDTNQTRISHRLPYQLVYSNTRPNTVKTSLEMPGPSRSKRHVPGKQSTKCRIPTPQGPVLTPRRKNRPRPVHAQRPVANPDGTIGEYAGPSDSRAPVYQSQEGNGQEAHSAGTSRSFRHCSPTFPEYIPSQPAASMDPHLVLRIAPRAPNAASNLRTKHKTAVAFSKVTLRPRFPLHS
jgi:hypothetical protein